MRTNAIFKKVRAVFFSLLAVFIIVLATVSAIVETETGSRWLVTRVAAIAGIELRGISGNLRRGLDIESLEYRTDQQFYRTQKLSFRWRPVDLLYGALAIQSLRAELVVIKPPQAAEKKAPEKPFNQWPQLHLPVRIYVQQAYIKNITLIQGNAQQSWQQLSGSLSWGTFNLRYDNLALVHNNYSMRLTGATELAFPYATKASVQWQWQSPDKNVAGSAPTLFASLVSSSVAPVIPTSSAPARLLMLRPPPVPLTYAGISEISGNLKALQVDTIMRSPVVLSGAITTSLVDKNNTLLTAPQLQLAANWQQQTLPASWWMPGKATPVTTGELTAKGNWQQYNATVRGDIHLPNAPMLGVEAAAQGDLQKIHIEFLNLRERYLSEAENARNSSVANSSIKKTAATNSSSASSSAISPAPKKYVDGDAGLSIHGDVHWLPQLRWQLAVSAEHLNLASLLADWPSNINASFSTQGFHTRSAQVASAIQAPGTFSNWNVQLQNLDVNGDLRGINLSADGSFAYDGKNLHSDALQFIFGANRLNVNGDIGEAFDLQWDINAPMLYQIDGSVQGSVISKGHLQGDAHKPKLEIDTEINDFSWGNYAVKKLQLALVPKNEAPQGPANTQPVATPATPIATPVAAAVIAALRDEEYSLTFAANQLQMGSNRFSTLIVNGFGSINQHNLEALVKHTTYGRADLKLRGEYHDAQWQGQFEQFALKLKKVPRWWLTSSQPIRINGDAIMLERQCLTTRSNLTGQVERISQVEQEEVIGEWMPNATFVKNNYDWLLGNKQLPVTPIETYSLPQLCIDGEWASATGARLNANLDSVPLRQFLSLFKVEVYFAGVMDGSLHASTPDFSLANTKASANVNTRNAELRYQYAGGTTEVYPWGKFSVQSVLQQGKLTSNGEMEWTGYGNINTAIELDLAQQKINNGNFIARFTNLAPLETVLPFANDVKGDFLADLTVAGTFAQPQVLGNVSLHNGVANLPRLGLDLTNIELQINSSTAGSINLVSQMQSDKGRLSLTGDLTKLGTPDWNLIGFINGNDFEVVALPELKATLSPDIKVSASNNTIELTGTAVIPWARANIKSLPESATQVSPDVVIVDEQFLQDEQGEELKILTNLNLSLGDDVHFNGFGLNSKLAGKINLLKETQRQFFTSGFVSVVDGSYKAYGQSLTIERGRLLFQGPYENPGLEIRASRTIRDADNTKVGLDISGTLQKPKATVFSSESMSESQAMMMLLTGKPLNEASKADASLLMSAMSGLGMDSGGSITSEITRFFHVDELEIKADQGLEQSELWVGKYLTPRLLVRYVVGIFDQAFSLGMEYQLTERLRIEAESGETQSVDVVYKVER
ncbi:MAG: hypothetical protein B0W54_13225 [Cellvibrio sp. 79]|nr:MAG: hypothetical protein B0W54_13225 [Cellvibrio sp. 79]